jgi:hypothetical protein
MSDTGAAAGAALFERERAAVDDDCGDMRFTKA